MSPHNGLSQMGCRVCYLNCISLYQFYAWAGKSGLSSLAVNYSGMVMGVPAHDYWLAGLTEIRLVPRSERRNSTVPFSAVVVPSRGFGLLSFIR